MNKTPYQTHMKQFDKLINKIDTFKESNAFDLLKQEVNMSGKPSNESEMPQLGLKSISLDPKSAQLPTKYRIKRIEDNLKQNNDVIFNKMRP